jgi:hypothetical protein
MKLLELTGIKNQYDKEITDIVINLIKKKYDFLGIGSFGTVFNNPKKPNEVIKFWFNDPGYEHFLKVAKSINSPHIIKVIKHGSITLNLDTPPIIILAVGKIALESLTGKRGVSILKSRGTLTDITIPGVYTDIKYPVFSILKPEYLMRSGFSENEDSPWTQTHKDIKKLYSLVSEVKK